MQHTSEIDHILLEHPEIVDQLKKINDFHKEVDSKFLRMEKFRIWMAFKFLPLYENNILALVYLGAAFLVIALGLRGLGSNIFMFLQENGRLANIYIYIALSFEFLMLIILSFVMFFKIEDHHSLYDHFFTQSNDTGSSFSAEEAIKVIKQLSKDYDELKRLLNNLSSMEKKLHITS